MNDKFAYLFISGMALVNLILLLTSDEYKRCKPCSKKTSAITIFAFYLHYFIHCFNLYGFLFNNKVILLIYLLTPPIVGIGWSLFSTKHFTSSCLLTNYTDIMCNVSDGKSIKFIEIFRKMGVPDINVMNSKTNAGYMVITTVGYFIGLVKLVFY
jgi:hypothetical protein